MAPNMKGSSLLSLTCIALIGNPPWTLHPLRPMSTRKRIFEELIA